MKGRNREKEKTGRAGGRGREGEGERGRGGERERGRGGETVRSF